jgi:heterotetrameric sarcosine oxidase gamma subunit
MRVSAPDPEPEAGVRLRELSADVVEIAAFRECGAQVRALAAERGWLLPQIGQVRHAPGGVALCVRPERWLLLSAKGATGALQHDWQSALGNAAASLDASSGLHALYLDGKAWRSMLARGSRIDLDPVMFTVGTAAATLIAQVSVILAGLAEGVMILTPASTARHLREWLLATSRPFGVDAPEGVTFDLFQGEQHA